jgi:hypothetical protein
VERAFLFTNSAPIWICASLRGIHVPKTLILLWGKYHTVQCRKANELEDSDDDFLPAFKPSSPKPAHVISSESESEQVST